MFSNSKGFTMLEIFIALGIMAVGFLAMSQMQFLSLRQTNLAQNGSKAVNLLQAVADRDMQLARMVHLFNSRVYLDAQSGKAIITQDDYCDGSPPSNCLHPPCEDICTTCPCDPLSIYTSNTASDNTETSCAFLSTVEFDPTNLNFTTTKSQCTNPACLTATPPCTLEFFVVRRVVTTVNQTAVPQEIDLRVTYALKTPQQFDDYTMGDPLRIIDTVVAQTYDMSAHIDQNWDAFINLSGQDWSNVSVPHIP